MNFEIVSKFEEKVAEFFGAKYAIAVDSCTHGIELCLRFERADYILCPKHTYLSIPFLAQKLGIELSWSEVGWEDYYELYPRIYDAAVLWKPNSYIKGSYMCISFQYQKHLSLGRGGIILTDNKDASIALKKMSYDGRLPIIPWREQNIDMVGYHYYMTPETATLGLAKLEKAIETEPRQWKMNDWPDLTQMSIFKK